MNRAIRSNLRFMSFQKSKNIKLIFGLKVKGIFKINMKFIT